MANVTKSKPFSETDYSIVATPPKTTAPTRPIIERDDVRPTAPPAAVVLLALEPEAVAVKVRDWTPALEHSELNSKNDHDILLRWSWEE